MKEPGYSYLFRNNFGLLLLSFLAVFSSSLGRVRATLQSAMVLGTAISPAVLGYLIDLGVDFQVILCGMLGYVVLAWGIAQPVLIKLSQQDP